MKIWKQFNKKTKRDEWHARFRINKIQFRPKADTKDALLDLVAEIRTQEKTVKENEKYGLKRDVPEYIPPAREILDEALKAVPAGPKHVFTKRVFDTFLSLLPLDIRPTELRKAHFQIYLTFRLGQLGKQSKKPIKRQTAMKELYAITRALGTAPMYFDSLENWQVPDLPEAPRGFNKKNKRERLVSDKELTDLIAELIKPPEGKQSFKMQRHRVRLARQLEFQYWTGLRRKEIARLKFAQYDETQQALLNVRRWKTDTVTKFFPLGVRAVEIIDQQRDAQNGSEFIFTENGEPVASDYRTLREVCKDLEIPYGKYVDGGFIAHDLRHNFGTEILRESDIETARELLGHSNITQTGTYIHTNADRMREAVRKRDKIDYKAELKKIYNEVKTGALDELEFNEKIRQLFRF